MGRHVRHGGQSGCQRLTAPDSSAAGTDQCVADPAPVTLHAGTYNNQGTQIVSNALSRNDQCVADLRSLYQCVADLRSLYILVHTITKKRNTLSRTDQCVADLLSLYMLLHTITKERKLLATR